MRNAIIVLIVFFFGCSSQPKQKLVVEFDRSTPEATYNLVSEGLKKKAFHPFIKSLSLQQKRYFLWTSISWAGLAPGNQKKKLNSLFQNSGIELNTLKQKLTNTNELVSTIQTQLKDLDSFLVEALEILHEDRDGRNHAEITDITIEGDRAIVSYNLIVQSVN